MSSRKRNNINGWKKWFWSEKGLSEVAGAIFVLPLMAFLIFALIEAGINMNARARVNSITQDTAMSIASDGAVWWVRTSPQGFGPDINWVTKGQERLEAVCSKSGNLCTDVEDVSLQCTVTNVDGSPSQNAGGVGAQIASSKGADVECVSEFPYKPISPLSRNPVTSFGFSSLFTKPITSQAQAETVVGLGD